jgi:hypothetical protein
MASHIRGSSCGGRKKGSDFFHMRQAHASSKSLNFHDASPDSFLHQTVCFEAVHNLLHNYLEILIVSSLSYCIFTLKTSLIFNFRHHLFS